MQIINKLELVKIIRQVRCISVRPSFTTLVLVVAELLNNNVVFSSLGSPH
jgi:hypothetical protein